MVNCRRWCTISVRGLLLLIAMIGVTLIPVHLVVRRIKAIEVLNRTFASVTWEDGEPVRNFDIGRFLRNSAVSVEAEATLPPTPVYAQIEMIEACRPVFRLAFYGGDCTVTDTDCRTIAQFRELRSLTIDSSSHTELGIRWVAQLDGLEQLRLRGHVTDSMIETISKMQSVRHLALNSWHVTDVGICRLSRMTQLEVLDISGTSITDAAIENLVDLPHLRVLWCVETQLTDRCVPSILQITNLGEIQLDLTNVSREGVRILKKENPRLTVNPS